MTKTEGYWAKLKAWFQVNLEKLKTQIAERRADRAEYNQWKAERKPDQGEDHLL